MNYILDEIPRGQLNNVILATMLDGEKYGYEIIDEIKKWSNGKIELKQPSLYSALNRMEAAELLSSYWKDSEIGGKRHYYRLTDLGNKTATSFAKKFLEEREASVGKEFGTILDQKNMFGLLKKEEKIEEKVEQQEKNDLQFNLFDAIPKNKIEDKREKINIKLKKIKNNDNLVQLKQFTEADRKAEFENLKRDRQNLSYSYQPVKTEQKFDYTFINNDKQLESKDIKKEIVEEEKIKQTFDISKYNSARDGYFLDNNSVKQEEVKEEKIAEQKDYSNLNAGTFLDSYERIEPKEVKKIEPYNLNIEIPSPMESITFKNSKPQNEEKVQKTTYKNTFSSFLGLKNYYSHQGIVLSEYKKTEDVYKKQNLNLALQNFYRSIFLLFISITLSFSLNFGIKQSMFGRITFILIPCIIAIISASYFAIYLYEKKATKSKFLILDVNNTFKNIITCVCFMLVVIAINLFFGFNALTGIYFLPTLIYPIIILAVVGLSAQINMVINKIFKLN